MISVWLTRSIQVVLVPTVVFNLCKCNILVTLHVLRKPLHSIGPLINYLYPPGLSPNKRWAWSRHLDGSPRANHRHALCE